MNMAETVSKLDQHFSHVPLASNVNRNDLQNIRDWIQTKPHLPYVSDRQISIFLHSCFGSIDKAKATIESYYTHRSHNDVFSNRTVADCIEAYRIMYITKLPTLSVDKCHILCMGLIAPNSSDWNTSLVIKGFFCAADMYTNIISYASGWRICIDCEKFSFGHLMKATVSLGIIKKAIDYVQDGLPIRLIGIHLINCNSVMCQITALVKPLMKKELYEIFHLHPPGDCSVYEYLPRKLPTNDPEKQDQDEYLPKLIEESIELIRKYEKWFQDDEYFARVDESKRITTSSSRSSLFSFR